MSARELGEWIAFERVAGPILMQERIDVAAATISATVAASGSGRAVDPARFLPTWDQKEQRSAQEPEDMIAVMRSIQKRKPADGN